MTPAVVQLLNRDRAGRAMHLDKDAIADCLHTGGGHDRANRVSVSWPSTSTSRSTGTPVLPGPWLAAAKADGTPQVPQKR